VRVRLVSLHLLGKCEYEPECERMSTRVSERESMRASWASTCERDERVSLCIFRESVRVNVPPRSSRDNNTRTRAYALSLSRRHHPSHAPYAHTLITPTLSLSLSLERIRFHALTLTLTQSMSVM
jgi:hypothetical protein